MAIVSVFAASHCGGDGLARELCKQLGYTYLDTKDLLADASSRFAVEPEKLVRAMHGTPSVFNRWTHEKERHLAIIQCALAERLRADDIVYYGFAGHLIPAGMENVLRVCLVANLDHRLARIMREEGIDERGARKLLADRDEESSRWTLHLYGVGPWEEKLYDIVLPLHSMRESEAVDLIAKHATRPPVTTTAESRRGLEDFVLASRVKLDLIRGGHDVDLEVTARNGAITVVINRYVSRVESLKANLRKLVLSMEGVAGVEIEIGANFRPPNRFERMVEERPAKILLVDDEREFVLTLSERLETRNLGSAIAYDGETALSIVETDAPDVIVLDLKMPGIDGIEVLRRVKKEKPETEIIILTGHGSESEEKFAMELGAYAYLKKPVNIDILAATMREAYRKVKGRKAAD